MAIYMTDHLTVEDIEHEGDFFDSEDYFNRYRGNHQQQTGISVNFNRIKTRLRNYLDTLGKEMGKAYNDKERDAILGDDAAADFFQDRIYTFMDLNPQYQQASYPKPYISLVDALYQETIGLGPLSAWFRSPNSPEAQINDLDILFEVEGEHVQQDFRFSSLNEVRRVINGLLMYHENLTLSAKNAEVELDMFDGTRVSILQPPTSRTYVVTFRRFPMKTYTWEHLASLNTIGLESISLYHHLSRMMTNIFNVGEPETGKTTLLKVIFNSRPIRKKCVSLESGHFEIDLKRSFPKRRAYIVETKSPVETMAKLFPKVLRMNANYLIVPETRSLEAEAMAMASERGASVIASGHWPEVLDIPQQLATEIMKGYPERNFMEEYHRVCQTLHVVIALRKLDGGRKVVDTVWAYDYDPNERFLKIIPWVTYVEKSDKWLYYFEMPERLAKRCQKYYPEEYAAFCNVLRDLVKLSPNEHPDIIEYQIGGNIHA